MCSLFVCYVVIVSLVFGWVCSLAISYVLDYVISLLDFVLDLCCTACVFFWLIVVAGLRLVGWAELLCVRCLL